MTNHASKKGSQKVLKNGYEFYSQKGFLEKEGSRRCLEHPFGDYDPLGVCPRLVLFQSAATMAQASLARFWLLSFQNTQPVQDAAVKNWTSTCYLLNGVEA